MVLAIDETKLKGNHFKLFVWSASHQRAVHSSINAMLFVRMVLSACTNKPVVAVDGAFALESYGFMRFRITFGKRNSIERYFGRRAKRGSAIT